MRKIASALAVTLALILLTIYAYNGFDENEWTLTQFPQVSGAQGMCYSLTDRKGHLILIDGGWDGNAETVLNLIIANDSHVDAWIITHSHQDHVSVFNNLCSGNFDFTIDEIICPDLDRDFYAEYADSADGGFEYYEAFRENLLRWDNVHFAHTGEELSICGLRAKIFNAFEKGNDLYEDDPENKGSLVFKLSGRDKSVLFCADATRPVGKELKKHWGEELKADMLQVSHHGVGYCMNSAFNLFVDPDIAFFDVPLGYISSDPEAEERMQDLIENGTEVYTFDTAPNTVRFQ